MKTHLPIAVLLCVLPLLGQSNRGEITGTVSDSTNAVVPGAQVVITNTETGANPTPSPREPAIIPFFNCR